MHVTVTVINAQQQGQRLPMLASETSPLTTQHISNETDDTMAVSKYCRRTEMCTLRPPMMAAVLLALHALYTYENDD